jgi:predicted lipoprotein with Yx(FWY)xxD motif
MTKGRPVLGSLAAAALALGSLALVVPAGAAKAAPTVTVVKAKGLVKILADSDGMALYTLTDDDGTAVACTDACASAWPPLTTTGSPKGAKGVKKLGVTDTGQVTHNGLPLYLFAADTTKGRATGEGIASFGGEWHVVKAKAATGASSGGSDSSSGDVGGLGY